METSASKAPQPKKRQGELLTLVAGDGMRHRTARATVGACQYFESKLARWEGDDIELDVDNDSLVAILTLLRYGPPGLPKLAPHLKAKVLKDADYLGVPHHLWAHLVEKPAEVPDKETTLKREEERENREVGAWDTQVGPTFHNCSRCRQHSARSVWICTTCAFRHPTSSRIYRPMSATVGNLGLAIMRCRTCQGLEYAQSCDICAVCQPVTLKIGS